MTKLDQARTLRDVTGYSITMCLEALNYAHGDLDVAVAYIKAKRYEMCDSSDKFNDYYCNVCLGGKLDKRVSKHYYKGLFKDLKGE